MRTLLKKTWKIMLLCPLFCLCFVANAQAQVNIDEMSDDDAHFYVDSWRVTHAEFMKVDPAQLVDMMVKKDTEEVSSIFITTKKPKDVSEAPGIVNGIPVSKGILDKIDPNDIENLTVANGGKPTITTKSGIMKFLPK